MTKPTAALLFLGLTGCAAQLKYVDRWPLKEAAARAVRIDVTDERPADQGGDNPKAVGIARGGYGNPTPFENDDPLQLTRLVRQATADALHGAGVDAADGATWVLRARVLKFWMDGYVGYAADAEVQYDLVSPAGGVVWSQRAKGHEAGAVFSFGAASDLLSAALAHLASDANAQFRRDEFKAAMSDESYPALPGGGGPRSGELRSSPR
ncbi:MAG: hypothetical protein JNK82_42415 [Myxococcaceae bacterium]|nr:hypothetical protein [Myxococcaceae bacterium]